MSKSKMDNMFREKLQDHKVTPGPEAWTKLKGNLDSDRKKFLLIYWRVAAIIIFLLASVFLVYKMNDAGLQTTVADKQEQEKIKPHVTNKNNSGQAEQNNQVAGQPDTQTEHLQNEEHPIESDKKQVESKSLAQKKPIRPEEAVEEPKRNNPQKSQVLAVTNQPWEKTAEDKSVNGEKPVHIETVKPIEPRTFLSHESRDQVPITTLDKRRESGSTFGEKDLPNITITFKKDESKILKESFADNEEQGKVRKFALRKVINLAKDIKEGEVGISTLREKKDELLAFNFNKKKKVKNSK